MLEGFPLGFFYAANKTCNNNMDGDKRISPFLWLNIKDEVKINRNASLRL